MLLEMCNLWWTLLSEWSWSPKGRVFFEYSFFIPLCDVWAADMPSLFATHAWRYWRYEKMLQKLCNENAKEEKLLNSWYYIIIYLIIEFLVLHSGRCKHQFRFGCAFFSMDPFGFHFATTYISDVINNFTSGEDPRSSLSLTWRSKILGMRRWSGGEKGGKLCQENRRMRQDGTRRLLRRK